MRTLQDEFVVEAIKEKLEHEKQQNLKQLVVEVYKATAKEDLGLTKESWRIFVSYANRPNPQSQPINYKLRINAS